MNVLGLAYSSDEETESVQGGTLLLNKGKGGSKDGNENSKTFKRSCKLPSPDVILDNTDPNVAKDLLLEARKNNHGGRVRTFGHVEGEYATSVFIPVELPETFRRAFKSFFEKVQETVPGLQLMASKELEWDTGSAQTNPSGVPEPAEEVALKRQALELNAEPFTASASSRKRLRGADSALLQHFGSSSARPSTGADVTSSFDDLSQSSHREETMKSHQIVDGRKIALKRMDDDITKVSKPEARFFTQQFHLSLSRTVMIRRDQIEALVSDLRSEIRRTIHQWVSAESEGERGASARSSCDESNSGESLVFKQQHADLMKNISRSDATPFGGAGRTTSLDMEHSSCHAGDSGAVHNAGRCRTMIGDVARTTTAPVDTSGLEGGVAVRAKDSMECPSDYNERGTHALTLRFAGFELFTNDDGSRTFLTIPLLNNDAPSASNGEETSKGLGESSLGKVKVNAEDAQKAATSGGSDVLLDFGAKLKVISLIHSVDRVFLRHGLRPFHQEPKPHVSIAWTLGRQIKKLRGALRDSFRNSASADEISTSVCQGLTTEKDGKLSDVDVAPQLVPTCLKFNQQVSSVLVVVGKRAYELFPLSL